MLQCLKIHKICLIFPKKNSAFSSIFYLNKMSCLTASFIFQNCCKMRLFEVIFKLCEEGGALTFLFLQQN